MKTMITAPRIPVTEDEFIGGAIVSYVGLKEETYTAQFCRDGLGGVPYLQVIGAGKTYSPIMSERDARIFFMNLPTDMTMVKESPDA